MRNKLVFLCGVVGLFSVVACSSTEQTPTAIATPTQQYPATAVEVSYNEFTATPHMTKQIEVTNPGTLQVILFSNPTTGYSWSENATIGDVSILRQESHGYVPPQTSGNVVGAGGKEAWVFKTLAPGATNISMDYSQPWAGGTKSTWTFALAVTVR